MSLADPLQSRLVLVVGGLAALALAVFMVARATVLSTDDSTPPPAAAKRAVPAAPAPPAPRVVKAPKIQLREGLPSGLARVLRRERVVVAALWAPRAGDLGALAEARAGAKRSGAGFVALNVLDDRQARLLQALVGTASDPAVFVFERPGTVVKRFEGFADRAIVAQAARNAGAR